MRSLPPSSARFVRAAVFSAAALMGACGGAKPSDLFSPSGDASDSVDSAGGGTVVDSGASTGSGQDSSMVQPMVDSAPPTDTSPPSMTPPDTGVTSMQTLPCGSGQPGCPVGPDEVCCVSGDVPNLSYQCTDANMCSGLPGVPVSCSGPADCPGQVCCGTETGMGQMTKYVGVECASTCNGITFCDPSAPKCNNGMCVASTLLPGYYVCRM